MWHPIVSKGKQIMNRNEVHAKCKEENIYYINNPKFFDKLEKITSRYPN